MVLIFAVFADQGETTKFYTSKFFNLQQCARLHAQLNLHHMHVITLRRHVTRNIYVHYVYTYVRVKFKMALLTSFAKQKKTNLLEPNVVLSSEVPSSAVVSANSKVQKIASSFERVWFL